MKFFLLKYFILYHISLFKNLYLYICKLLLYYKYINFYEIIFSHFIDLFFIIYLGNFTNSELPLTRN